MFCHKCGAKQIEGAAFCHKCGTAIHIEDAASITERSSRCVNAVDCVSNDAGDDFIRNAKAASDPEDSVKWWRKAAEIGIAEAQYNLGLCYYNENGVDEDEDEAVKWYLKAAEQGHAEAQYELYNCYSLGGLAEENDEEAFKWCRKSADQGLAKAQVKLGDCYRHGWGVEVSEDEAIKWYRIAAEQGDSNAQYKLGECYIDGLGVEEERNEAIKWFRKAAEQYDHLATKKLEQLGVDFIDPLAAAREELNANIKELEEVEENDREAERKAAVDDGIRNEFWDDVGSGKGFGVSALKAVASIAKDEFGRKHKK